MSKFGAYLAPHHDPAVWQEYLFMLSPNFVRILMPGDAPASIVSQVYHIVPDARISLRWWDVDDGGDGPKRDKLNNASSAAAASVEEYAKRISAMEAEARSKGLPFPPREQLYINTLNEPPIWVDGVRPQVVDYCVAFLNAAHHLGFNSLVGEISVGHPSEWPPTWDWFAAVAMGMDVGDALALHEYWQPEGPHYEWTDEKGNSRKDWGALAGRYMSCPLQVPIVITECGVDGRIYNRHQPPDTGWQKFMQADAYAAQVGAYLAEVEKDSRIYSVLPFLTDYQDGEWHSFDTLPAVAAFDKMLEAYENTVVPPSGGSGSHLPYTPNGSSGTGASKRALLGTLLAVLLVELERDGLGHAVRTQDWASIAQTYTEDEEASEYTSRLRAAYEELRSE